MNQSLKIRTRLRSDPRKTLAQVEEAYIEKIIRETDTLAEAARVLDVNPSMIYRRTHRKQADIVLLPGTVSETIDPSLHVWALQRLQEQMLDAEIAWRKECREWRKGICG